MKKILPPLNPNWYYSVADVPNCNKISEELLNLQRVSNDKIFASNHLEFFNINWDKAKPHLPSLCQLLTECGCLHKIDRILFSYKSPKLKVECKIHVDSYVPQGTPFALNFPLYMCDNSYIAFYKLKNEKTLLKNASDFRGAKPSNDLFNYATAEDDEVEEITRFKMTRPVLVNTTYLHTGLKENNDRVIASIRFYMNDLPSINQLKQMGVIDPFIQHE